MPDPAATVRALVAGLVDYAGLFPPASCGMSQAAEEYATHLRSPERWLLGRIVVPAARLGELSRALASAFDERTGAWRVSAIAGDDLPADLQRIASFNEGERERAAVEAIEFRAESAESVARLLAIVPDELEIYVELALDTSRAEMDERLEAIGAGGARAKLRAGGTVAAAIPGAAAMASAIARCARAGIPFKATAGLHHPLCGDHPLTYEPGAPVARMFGFLNLFMAATLLHTGGSDILASRLLADDDPASFGFDDAHARWRDVTLTLGEVRAARAGFATTFGSCSFREPVHGLRALGLL